MWEKTYSQQNITTNAIRKFAEQRNLQCSLASTLKTKDENQHFHFKMKKEKGVLEVTLFADEIQLHVHENRRGNWVENEITAWENWIQTIG